MKKLLCVILSVLMIGAVLVLASCKSKEPAAPATLKFGVGVSIEASAKDATADFRTKCEKGNDYGMSKTGKQEWYVQAAAFETQCIGKTAAEIATLMVEGGKGTEAVITAGCTIGVAGFVEAAAKIG